MRIIAGTYKGRPLVSVRDRSVRPTTGRAKKTIFDILQHRIDFSGKSVLDLFAGSGSLGLEALSRGAESVVFVENSSRSIAVLEKNIRALNCESQCTVYRADVFWFLKTYRRTFDVIFVDPPYTLETLGLLPGAIGNSNVIRPNTYVVMEHSKETPVDIPAESFEVIRKPFGQTMVLILRFRVSPPVPSTHRDTLKESV
ncbi:MAG TPA: 16S rRNA (guanine(966)-N(2))-methyltransferase RsmD [Bacteroidota bacterium]|nr:16S rRNA (guanine(966)-N(2))-methyltransferase RsmD [Bacteroidota bacterium]